MELYDIYQVPPVPYRAGELPRYTEDELQRIADLKEDRLNQCELHWDEQSYPITINTVTPPAIGPWTNLIPPGTAVDYVRPSLMYDQTTGVITAPHDGIYLIESGVCIPDPGGTVTLDMWIGLGGWFNSPATPSGVEFFNQTPQTKQTSSHFAWNINGVSAGDTLDPIISVYADSYTAAVTGRVYLQIWRLR